MRINAILIVLILLLFISATCSRETQVNAEGFKPLKEKMDLQDFSDDCQKFIKKELRPNWLLHTSEKCYFDNQELWESVLSQKECFIGKKKEQIQSIFGKPSNIFTLKDTWEKYNMGKICEKNYQYFNLQFHYDENEVLKNIGQGQIRNN